MTTYIREFSKFVNESYIRAEVDVTLNEIVGCVEVFFLCSFPHSRDVMVSKSGVFVRVNCGSIAASINQSKAIYPT